MHFRVTGRVHKLGPLLALVHSHSAREFRIQSILVHYNYKYWIVYAFVSLKINKYPTIELIKKGRERQREERMK